MKNIKPVKILSIVSAFLLILSSCTQGPVDVKTEIQDANKAFVEAFNNQDAAALAQAYTTDAKVFPPNSDVIQGTEGIEALWSGAFNMGIKKASLETVKADAYGDTAIEEGKYTLYIDDETVADQGKYIVIWKKIEGVWKLNCDIWNTSLPLPPPEAEDSPETE